MKIHDLEVTGSLIYNGVNLLSLTSSVTDSGSFSTQIVNLNQVSSSLNSFTSSINTTIKSKLDSESVISGSAQVSITDTTGYSTFSSSISSSIGSLSGSVATTTSGLAGRITTIEGNYATTGSNIFSGNQVITGSICSTGNIVTTGQIVAQTINVQQVTSSIVYSCGSNIFGNSISNTQQFTGSVSVTGSLTIVGPLSATTIYGSTVVCSAVGYFSGCVGIGTNTPSTKLHIEATGPTRGIIGTIKNATQTGAQVHFVQDSVADWVIGQPANTNAFAFWNNRYPSNDGTELMRITSTGNVGIGTCNPEGVLTIQGTSVQPPTSGTTANSLLQLVGSLNNQLNIGSNTSAGGYGSYIQASDNNLAVPYQLNLQPNGGNVGIGTNSPVTLDSGGVNLQIKDRSALFQLAAVNSTYLSNNIYYDGSWKRIVSGYGTLIRLTDDNNGFSFLTTGTGGANSAVTFTSAMNITNAGNVGIDATTTYAKLHIGTASNNENNIFFTRQTTTANVIIGGLRSSLGPYWGDATSTSLAEINLETDNPYYRGAISFRTNNSDATANRAVERMRISSSGVVTITHPSSDAQLFISACGATAYVRFANSAGDIWGLGNSFSGPNTDFQLYNFTTAAYGFRVSRGGIYANTTAAAANVQIDSNGYFARSTSSLKYKNSITNYDKGLDIVNQLRPVYYKGNNDGDTIFAGLIAEEVHDLGLTEFVQYTEDGTPDALSYSHMVSLLTKAIQEQQSTICSQSQKIAILESCLGIM